MPAKHALYNWLPRFAAGFLIGALCCAPIESSRATVLLQPFHLFYGLGWDNLSLDEFSPSTPLIQARDGNLYGVVDVGGMYGYGFAFRVSTNGSFTLLHSFSGGNDGGLPRAALTQASDGNLYGTTTVGGADYAGTIFKMSIDGALSTLYSLNGDFYSFGPNTAFVQAGDGYLYGAAAAGGGGGANMFFRITTNGLLTPLYTNAEYNANDPSTSLTLGIDGNLYGTICSPSPFIMIPGEAFRLTTNGAYSVLYPFTIEDAYPNGVVQASNGTLYGTTPTQGAGEGVVFALTTNGALSNIYNFPNTGPQGHPEAGLIQASDGNLYGTTDGDRSGTIFRVTTNGLETILYEFSGGSDGGYPSALLQATDGNFYGTTETGGTGNRGTIFRLSTTGGSNNFTTLYSFASANIGRYPDGAVVDGYPDVANPDSGMTQASDGNLYGSTPVGGLDDDGVVFQLTTNGLFTVLYSFTNGTDGATPSSPVQAVGGYIYGTTAVGGANGKGTIFRIATNGALASLYSFTGTNDGATPLHGIILAADGNFYGTTSSAGASGGGTIFQFTTNAAFEVVYTFTNGSDGSDPVGLVQANGLNLYGMAYSGGSGGNGTIFQINFEGTLTILHAFTGGADGAEPWGPSLLATNGYAYGTTLSGGNAPGGGGTVFRMTAGGILTTLYSFAGGLDGSTPTGLAFGADGNLYGATKLGGPYGSGTIFQINTNGTFSVINSFFISDGFEPVGSLLSAGDGNIYGTAQLYSSPIDCYGTIFRIIITSSNAPIPGFQTPTLSAGNLNFAFPAAAGQSYFIQQATNLAATNWTFFTNLIGAGSAVQLSVPATNSAQFFRLREP